MRHLERFLREHPDDAEVLGLYADMLGDAVLRGGDLARLDAAINANERVLRLDPEGAFDADGDARQDNRLDLAKLYIISSERDRGRGQAGQDRPGRSVCGDEREVSGRRAGAPRADPPGRGGRARAVGGRRAGGRLRPRALPAARHRPGGSGRRQAGAAAQGGRPGLRRRPRDRSDRRAVGRPARPARPRPAEGPRGRASASWTASSATPPTRPTPSWSSTASTSTTTRSGPRRRWTGPSSWPTTTTSTSS